MRFSPSLESLESRALTTLVFVMNGNGFGAAAPDHITRTVAIDLVRHGNRAVQLATPAMNGLGSFLSLAGQLKRMSKGQPIGLVGFSAGGSLALRLAQVPGLNVKSVLNFYGPPDLRDWLDQHRGDAAFRYVGTHARLTPGFVQRMSGPARSGAHVVSVFGLADPTVNASESAASMQRDFPDGAVYFYPGAHGVTINASYGAYLDFLGPL